MIIFQMTGKLLVGQVIQIVWLKEYTHLLSWLFEMAPAVGETPKAVPEVTEPLEVKGVFGILLVNAAETERLVVSKVTEVSIKVVSVAEVTVMNRVELGMVVLFVGDIWLLVVAGAPEGIWIDEDEASVLDTGWFWLVLLVTLVLAGLLKLLLEGESEDIYQRLELWSFEAWRGLQHPVDGHGSNLTDNHRYYL
jgi:hypothetical protein